MSDPIALHVCCAPCLAASRSVTDSTLPPVAHLFFHNPNIHPLLEFRRRQKALRVYLERDPISAEIDGEYGLDDFLARVLVDGRRPEKRRDRCFRCYLMRFERMAEFCARNRFGAFSTTLFASREQDHDLLNEAGREAASKRNLEFVRADFRNGCPPDRLMRGIYRQQYCGCVFSEEERYKATNKHLYRPGDSPDASGEMHPK